MKLFIAGVAMGIVAGFAIAILMRASVPVTPVRAHAADPSANAIRQSHDAPIVPGAARETPLIDATATTPRNDRTDKRATDTASNASASVSDAAAALAALSDEDIQRISLERYQQAERRKQAARDAEPKDAGWAYSMEELIRQYIGTRTNGAQYDRLKIDCHTTFCAVTAEGDVLEDQERFRALTSKLDLQPWAGDLLTGGSGSGSSGPNWHAHSEFRRMTEEEKKQLGWSKERRRSAEGAREGPL